MTGLLNSADLIEAALDADSIHIVAMFRSTLAADGLVEVDHSGHCFNRLRPIVKARLRGSGLDLRELTDDELDKKAADKWLLALRRIETRHRDIDAFIDNFIGGKLRYMFLDPEAGAISFHSLDDFGSLYMATIRQEQVAVFREQSDRLAREVRRSVGLQPS